MPEYDDLAAAAGLVLCGGCEAVSKQGHEDGRRIGNVMHWRRRRPDRRGYRRFAYIAVGGGEAEHWQEVIAAVKNAAALVRRCHVRIPMADWPEYAAAKRARERALAEERSRRPLTQRQIRELLPILIDAAIADRSGRGRERLRKVLARSRWMTAYVLHNIGSRRCRYLAALGYPIPIRYLQTRPLGRLIS